MIYPAPRGYIGLIGLLIGVAIIGFFFWRPDLFAPASTAESAPDAQRANQYEQGRASVDAAEAAKQQVEDSYRYERADTE